MDDLTLGEMLTEAYRGPVDYSVREGVSVSQSSSSLSDRTRQPVGDRAGQPDECNSSKAHLRLYLRSKNRQFLRNVTQESVITNSKQVKPKKSADSLKDNYGDGSWNFVGLIGGVLLRWVNCGSFRILNSILARRKFIEDQNTILELGQRVQELQNKVNCINDSKDFQDAESIRSGNSHVTRRPVSFPPHPIPEGMLRRSIETPNRREGPPSIWETWYIGNRFCKSRCVILSSLSSRIASMEFIDRRAAPNVHSGDK